MLYRSNTRWWVQEEEQDAVVAEQEKRTSVDPLSDRVVPLLDGKHIITRAAIFDGLGFSTKEINSYSSQRIGRIMLKLGWKEGRDRRGGGDAAAFINPAYEGEDQLSKEW